MNPLDIVVILKLVSLRISKRIDTISMRELEEEIYISSSEISRSYARLKKAKLLNDKMDILYRNLLEFLVSGMPYAFPSELGRRRIGIATAHSSEYLKNELLSDEPVVWAYKLGDEKGPSIEPLHKNVPLACLYDRKLYELLAYCEVLRAGRPREKKIVIERLENLFNEANQ